MTIYTSQIILVTGPARSGKSEWAEDLARQTAQSVIYVATAIANPDDVEWLTRIETHQQRRPVEWTTQLVPVELAATIRDYGDSGCCLLVDSLGTWVANLLEQDEADWEKTLQDLLNSLVQTTGYVIFVAEETGWGVVPAYPIGRLFRDRLGELVRKIGIIANTVYLVTGGHVLNLSALGSPLQK
ncbi:bifunctional adenosylcobinamide kinase/adenosylcobinamide-phosphate guanylyltransferase [Allocoleopsis franciscana]|uniref:Adenosylcobinamide kinase n=1 Tax=Allocoleopsis franciscana PCC 7113 TaxID=1173027 RepID=K9WFL0_9CYAN|nr:bifunctional adenosylcobinamide kinase/adenosylcobinamide-phosphate guanylyltransferase [Allocoleopsis franciscana]AFZ19190.1 adenosyl cobinamide kinase/adenosyl cobinamide phosphate guanylyltransferase [Allocoleopsis franciscana PCC 7113]